jgi:hypothetical protein
MSVASHPDDGPHASTGVAHLQEVFDSSASRRGESDLDIAAWFTAAIHHIAKEHEPARFPFFNRLRTLPTSIAMDPDLLGQIHLVYQSAMHATRAAVYFLPHLDSPAMRKRKLRIFIDDDGLADGDTHHYQLTRAFDRMGAKLLLPDEAFGGAADLRGSLDAATFNFMQRAAALYAHSLGPWCVVELLSNTWMHALADALAVHFPDIINEPYFADCFSQGIEERHADESLAVTGLVLRKSPHLWAETIHDARLMAEALDGVWNTLDDIVRRAGQDHANQRAGGPDAAMPGSGGVGMTSLEATGDTVPAPG